MSKKIKHLELKPAEIQLLLTSLRHEYCLLRYGDIADHISGKDDLIKDLISKIEE